MSELKFDSVTPFCDFLLSVLSGLASFPASSGAFCSLTLPLTQNCAQGGFCFDLLLDRWAQALNGWLPHSAAAPGVSPPFPATCFSVMPEGPKCPGKGTRKASRICTEHQIWHWQPKSLLTICDPNCSVPGRISQQRSHRNKLTLYQKRDPYVKSLLVYVEVPGKELLLFEQ